MRSRPFPRQGFDAPHPSGLAIEAGEAVHVGGVCMLGASLPVSAQCALGGHAAVGPRLRVGRASPVIVAALMSRPEPVAGARGPRNRRGPCEPNKSRRCRLATVAIVSRA